MLQRLPGKQDQQKGLKAVSQLPHGLLKHLPTGVSDKPNSFCQEKHITSWKVQKDLALKSIPKKIYPLPNSQTRICQGSCFKSRCLVRFNKAPDELIMDTNTTFNASCARFRTSSTISSGSASTSVRPRTTLPVKDSCVGLSGLSLAKAS